MAFSFARWNIFPCGNAKYLEIKDIWSYVCNILLWQKNSNPLHMKILKHTLTELIDEAVIKSAQ